MFHVLYAGNPEAFASMLNKISCNDFDTWYGEEIRQQEQRAASAKEGHSKGGCALKGDGYQV